MGLLLSARCRGRVDVPFLKALAEGGKPVWVALVMGGDTIVPLPCLSSFGDALNVAHAGEQK